MAWRCVGVLGVALGVACTSEPPPSGADDSSTGAAEGDSTGSTRGTTAEPTGSTESTGSSTTDGTTEGSSTGEPVDECPPRAFESPLAWEVVDPSDPLFGVYESVSQCTFVQQLEPVEPGTLELELACEPTADSLPAQLHLRLWLELDTLPFIPGEPMELLVVSEPDGAINEQLLLSLRDAEGELLLAGFDGYQPMGKTPETAAFFDPLSIALVDAGCLVPCEDFGCLTRAALDVSLATETTRIFDGSAADVGAAPAYRVHVGNATIGSAGLDDPGAHIGMVIVRQP